jgi:hypothetical protein
MSQFFVGVTSGALPPVVPTTFETQDGDAVPAANILIVNGFDSTENNVNGIITKGGTPATSLANEVDVIITNRLQGTVSSVNAATANLITFALGASAAVYRFTFDVTGRDTATGDGVGYTVLGSARTTGAAATVIASPFTDNDEDASLLLATVDLVASGNSVILQVTGVAGQTISYSAVGTYVVV